MIVKESKPNKTSVSIRDSTSDALGHMALILLAASFGVKTSRLQRPSIRADSSVRHPILFASFDDSRKSFGRRPHLYDDLLSRPENSPGRLHPHL